MKHVYLTLMFAVVLEMFRVWERDMGSMIWTEAVALALDSEPACCDFSPFQKTEHLLTVPHTLSPPQEHSLLTFPASDAQGRQIMSSAVNSLDKVAALLESSANQVTDSKSPRPTCRSTCRPLRSTSRLV